MAKAYRGVLKAGLDLTFPSHDLLGSVAAGCKFVKNFASFSGEFPIILKL